MHKDLKKTKKKIFHALDKATSFAVENRDVEALIAIAERWMLAYDRLDAENQANSQLSIGFVEHEKHDRGKASHKREN